MKGRGRCSHCRGWGDVFPWEIRFTRPAADTGPRLRRFCTERCLARWSLERGLIPVQLLDAEALATVRAKADGPTPLVCEAVTGVPSCRHRPERGEHVALEPNDRPPSQLTRDDRVFYPVGVRVEAGWYDDRGRQYTWDMRLLCEGCGCSSDEALLNGGHEYAARGRVNTDVKGRTFCRECRYMADVLGVDPRREASVL